LKSRPQFGLNCSIVSLENYENKSVLNLCQYQRQLPYHGEDINSM